MHEHSIAVASSHSPWRKRIAVGGVFVAPGALAIGLRLTMVSPDPVTSAAAAMNPSAQAPLPGPHGTEIDTPPRGTGAAGPVDPRAALGRKIFFDASFSRPAGTSCATCHDPARGFAGNNGSTRGVPRGSRPGHFARRSTPSVLYLRFVPRFHFHWDEDVDLPDGVGGFFWDGRTDSLAALVAQPLLNRTR